MYSINRLLSITIGNNRAYLDVQYVNIAMLVWGCVFCLIAGVGMILSKNFDRRKRLWMILLQFATVVLLLSDATACIFRGWTGIFGYWIVRISNFIFVPQVCVQFYFYGTGRKNFKKSNIYKYTVCRGSSSGYYFTVYRFVLLL